MGVGEEAVVANAMETGRQHVEQEAPHELADVEAHDLALVTTALPIVLPAETDMGLVKIEQAAVSDCDAMRVARFLLHVLCRPVSIAFATTASSPTPIAPTSS